MTRKKESPRCPWRGCALSDLDWARDRAWSDVKRRIRRRDWRGAWSRFLDWAGLVLL